MLTPVSEISHLWHQVLASSFQNDPSFRAERLAVPKLKKTAESLRTKIKLNNPNASCLIADTTLKSEQAFSILTFLFEIRVTSPALSIYLTVSPPHQPEP